MSNQQKLEQLKLKARVKGFTLAQAWQLKEGPDGHFILNKNGLISVILRNLDDVEKALSIKNEGGEQ